VRQFKSVEDFLEDSKSFYKLNSFFNIIFSFLHTPNELFTFLHSYKHIFPAIFKGCYWERRFASLTPIYKHATKAFYDPKRYPKKRSLAQIGISENMLRLIYTK
jgi:hypothetical protein